MSDCRAKNSLDEGELSEERKVKAKRHDIELPPSAVVDVNLAEKLDSILSVSSTRKPRFLTNKPKSTTKNESQSSSKIESKSPEHGQLKARCLTVKELEQRILKNYETLVPHLDPKRSKVKVVKILSATEALEMGKAQAKKQLERQLHLNSVSGNQNARVNGLKEFRFNDGYEMSMNGDKQDQRNDESVTSKIRDKPKIHLESSSEQKSKSVRFDDHVTYHTDDEDDDEEQLTPFQKDPYYFMYGGEGLVIEDEDIS